MTFSLQYGDGSASSGFIGSDVLSISGVKVQNQAFGEASILNGFTQNTFDGIIGLGEFLPNGTSLENSAYVLPIQNMFDQKLISNRVFSVALHTLPKGSTEDTTGGEIIFGGINPNKFIGNLTYLPVVNLVKGNLGNMPLLWSATLSQMAVAGKVANITNAVAVFDTGSSFFAIPQAYVTSIFGLLGAFVDPYAGLPWIDCNTINSGAANSIGSITFFLGPDNQPFTVPYNHWIEMTTSSDPAVGQIIQNLAYVNPGQVPAYLKQGLPQYCFLKITGLDLDLWILGDPFLRTYYAVFDVDNLRVGLAPQTGYSPNNVTLFASQTNPSQAGPTIGGVPGGSVATSSGNSQRSLQSSGVMLIIASLLLGVFGVSLI